MEKKPPKISEDRGLTGLFNYWIIQLYTVTNIQIKLIPVTFLNQQTSKTKQCKRSATDIYFFILSK